MSGDVPAMTVVGGNLEILGNTVIHKDLVVAGKTTLGGDSSDVNNLIPTGMTLTKKSDFES